MSRRSLCAWNVSLDERKMRPAITAQTTSDEQADTVMRHADNGSVPVQPDLIRLHSSLPGDAVL